MYIFALAYDLYPILVPLADKYMGQIVTNLLLRQTSRHFIQLQSNMPCAQ